MNEATIALTICTGLIFLIFLGFLIWGIKSGQFKHVEEAKYRMLEDNLKSEDENLTEQSK
jgi:cbb3-type cytochrome oxidase maturation protein